MWSTVPSMIGKSPYRGPQGYPNQLSLRSTVGAAGFEPATSRTRTVRATGLRYAPNETWNILAQLQNTDTLFELVGVSVRAGSSMDKYNSRI